MKSVTKSIIILFLITIVLAPLSGCRKGEEDPAISLRTRKMRVTGEWEVTSMNFTETMEASDGVDSTSSSIISFDGTIYKSAYLRNEEDFDYTFKDSVQSQGNGEITYSFDGENRFTATYITDLDINSFFFEDYTFPFNFRREVTTTKKEKKTFKISGTWTFLSADEYYRNKENLILIYKTMEIVSSGSFTTTTSDTQNNITVSKKESGTFSNPEEIYFTGNEKNEIWSLSRLSNKEMEVRITNSSSRGGEIQEGDDSHSYTVNSSGEGDFSLIKR